MRSCVVVGLLVAPAIAAADDEEPAVRAHGLRRDAEPAEPWLHLDATLVDPAAVEGGIRDRRRAQLALGPRARLRAEGTWWQSGLAPSAFATDLDVHGWRASGELSYDLGWFHLGVNASMARVGDASHRMVGLFAYRTFRLSRWMRAWIVLGVAFEQWDHAAPATGPRQGVNAGLTFGTTFR